MVQNETAQKNQMDITDKQGPPEELMSLMEEEVTRAKDQNTPIIRAFEAIAKKTGLKPNTIRNYYYQYIHTAEKTTENPGINMMGSVGINHEIGKEFSEDEIKALMIEMLAAQARGESVRGCANRLGNGDYNVLIRFQNKYRNTVAKKRRYVEALMDEMNSKGIPYFNPYTKKVVKSRGSQRRDWQPKESAGIAESKNNGRTSGEDPEEFVSVLSQLVSSMQQVKDVSLHGFFRGLRDLSTLAMERRIQDDKLKKVDQLQEMLDRKDKTLQELNSKALLFENKLREYGEMNSRLMTVIQQMAHINRDFLKLPGAGKVAELYDYTQELEGCMKEYDAVMDDYRM